jgi:hypothetical protein
MSHGADPSPRMHDPRTQSSADYAFREGLEAYLRDGLGTLTEKIENFPKYATRQNLARFVARTELFKQVLDVQGSVVECGVMFGGGLMTFAQLSTILEPYNFQRRIIGFDTFEGFPALSDEDVKGLPERKSAHLKVGGFAVPNASEDLLEAIRLYDMNRFLNHFPKVHVVKGDFAVTSRQFLADYPHLVISLLYLDFDIYAPTKLAIERFFHRIPRGGMIVFDELNDEAFPGETLAVMEQLGLGTLRIRRFPYEPRISYAIVGD